MQKLIKLFFVLFSGLILLLIIAMIALTTLINPNDFKPQLSKKVYELTGRQLVLNGNIHWSFFPSLGLQVNNAQLSNAKNFGAQPFAQIKHVEAYTKLLPLLKGNIAIDTIAIDGLELNLIKNAQGVTNWQDLSEKPAKKSPVASNDTTSLMAVFGIANATAATRDTNKTPSHYFQMANFAIANFDITNSHITWNNQQNNQRYDISQLKLKSQKFQLGQTTPLDMQFVLQSIQPKINAEIYIDGAININPKKLSDFSLQGKLRSKQLQFEKFLITEINTLFNVKNGLIKLNPVDAKLYQGNYNGNIILDTNGATTKITTDSNFTNIQAEPLMQALAGVTRIQVAGIANLNTHLTIQGDIKTLNGNGNFILKNGVLKGIDVRYWLQAAQALAHKQNFTQTNTEQTHFDSLSGSFVIRNGVVENNDLVLQATDASANGHGKADLVNKQLNYQLSLQRVRNGELKDAPIPLIISGNFSNLSIRLNVESLITQQAKEQIKVKLGEQLQKSLGKELGDQLGKQLGDLLH